MMQRFFQAALDELKAGCSVFACFVAANRKGSPGTPAARMFCFESGAQLGTVGGGIMEKRILEAAGEVLQSGAGLPPKLDELAHHASDKAEPSGLICGGGQSNVSLVWEPTEVNCKLLRELLEHSDQSGALCIDPKGARFVDVPMKAPQTLARSESGWEYCLNLVNQRRVAIFGGGHCGCALAEQMQRLNYAVTLIEPRADVATLSQLQSSINVVNASYALAVDQLTLAEKTHAVVMTHSLLSDIDALKALIPSEFLTIGVMGSAPKIKRIREALSSAGISDSVISQVRAPIGLNIDSDTPEEIAVSIAAQFLLER